MTEPITVLDILCAFALGGLIVHLAQSPRTNDDVETAE